jgi:hypothetical protein
MHDPKCEELARYFLEDESMATEKHIQELADVIQQAIEGWLEKSPLR